MAMALVQLKISKGPSFGIPSSTGSVPIFSMMAKTDRKIAMIEEAEHLKEVSEGLV